MSEHDPFYHALQSAIHAALSTISELSRQPLAHGAVADLDDVRECVEDVQKIHAATMVLYAARIAYLNDNRRATARLQAQDFLGGMRDSLHELQGAAARLQDEIIEEQPLVHYVN